METQKKERKPTERRKIPYQVEVQETVGGSWKAAPQVADEPDSATESTTEASRWIKNFGQPGKSYRCAHITFGPVKVKEVHATKRVFE